MSRANSNPLVAALLWALCALCAASGAAAQSNDTLVTPFEPTLTPWAAGCSVVSSSSSAGTEGMSSGRITLVCVGLLYKFAAGRSLLNK